MVQIDRKATGNNIRQIMENKGVTVPNVARKLAVTPNYVYKFWYGRIPSVNVLINLSNVLEVPMDNIIITKAV